MPPVTNHLVETTADLERIYGAPLERSLRKQLDHLDEYCRAFIAASPFLILGTQQPGGCADNSPRGDKPGFVRVADERTLLIPDRRGNNRVDALHNILENSAVGLLFLIPGITHTLRVNGDAVISTDPDLLAQFAVEGKAPRTVLILTVKEAYAHCSRALVRADLWNPARHVHEGAVPTFGAMLEAHTCGFVEGKALDEENKVRVPLTLY